MAVSGRKNGAFTLVELLVVITILGILMALLLPAISSVRESMRRAQCKNNLAQLGRAEQEYLAVQGHFPSSGWGYMWTGDPDYGYGARQCGGWIYNSLPYLGLDMIHDIGKGLSVNAKFKALAEAKSAAIPLLICQTRRRPIAYPSIEQDFNATPAGVLNKTDYAANGGSIVFLGCGPPYTTDYKSSCRYLYPNCDWTYWGWVDYSSEALQRFNGVSGERSEVQSGHVSDGLSNVFYAGEKYLNPDLYYTGTDGADNDTALEGNDWDVNRWVTLPPMRDTKGQDTMSTRFGSAHPAGLNFVFCDGHVQLLSFQMDFASYQSLGVRNDGNPSDTY